MDRGTTRDIGESVQGIQSIEIGGRILFMLCDEQGPVTLTHLAKKTGMHPSAVRRYLVSYSRIGLVRQNTDGLYDIGPRALDLGLNILGRIDVVTEASPIIQALRDKLGEGVGLTMWVEEQLVMMRFVEAPKNIVTKVRVGSTVPMLGAASGHLFATFLPEDVATAAVRAELRAGSRLIEPATVSNLKEFHALRKSVLKRGYAIYREQAHSNCVSIAAPVFDANGSIIAALAVMGWIGITDESEDGPVVTSIRESAYEISRRLGWRDEASLAAIA